MTELLDYLVNADAGNNPPSVREAGLLVITVRVKTQHGVNHHCFDLPIDLAALEAGKLPSVPVVPQGEALRLNFARYLAEPSPADAMVFESQQEDASVPTEDLPLWLNLKLRWAKSIGWTAEVPPSTHQLELMTAEMVQERTR